MLKIEGVSKSFGKKQVLKQVSFTVERWEICALLGINGAGKTTLFNLILDLLPADSGTVLFEGQSVAGDIQAFRKQIGVVPSDDQLIEAFTARDFLRFSGTAYGVPKKELSERIESLISYFFDEDPKGKPLSTFSTGMKKKIALCAAVLHSPRFLLLDEPFAGLDPLVSVSVVSFLKTYAESGRAVLVSSHDLEYVAKMATHVVVLHEGGIRFNGEMDLFTEKGNELLSGALFKLLVPATRDQSGMNWLLR